jgi:AraC-like DNA-binding protein
MRIVESRQRGSRGILLPWDERALSLVRLEPSSDLAPFVERHWILRWTLGSRTHLQRVVGFPSVDLVFEPAGARVYGPMTGTLERRFEGSGCVFATKFRPGAWSTLSRTPVRALVDRSVPFAETCGAHAVDSVELTGVSDTEYRCRVEDILRALSPRRDARAELAACIVDRILADDTIIRARQLEDLFDLRERTLQRIFLDYVGWGVKRVIRRARLQLAAERLRTGHATAALAHELGYFDQAHFDHDFRQLFGVSPGRYRARLG